MTLDSSRPADSYFDPSAVANYFLAKGREAGKPITQMKLHKLIYYANGWNLAIRGEPLIREPVEAWEYGPVVPSIYHEFKDFGAKPITRYARAVDENGELYPPAIDKAHVETLKLLDRIWEVYGDRTAAQLSQMTHKPGSPWSLTREKFPQMKGVDIPSDLTKQWFTDLVTARRNG